MFKKLKKVTALLLPISLMATTTLSAFGAPAHQAENCSQDYVVQANDWLSKLAEKQYGDPLAYPTIVEATNAAAAGDDSFAVIDNPDLIEVGWKLCLPETAEAPLAAGPATFTVHIENVSDFTHAASGVFNTPTGATEPGPLLPGNSYEFSFNAAPGDRLSFASMIVQSNDWFIGPNTSGIALFNDGSPVSGDISDQLSIWDAGTEIDQEPGLGLDQAPRQAGPDTGEIDPNNTVRLVASEAGGLSAGDIVRVILTVTGDNSFTVSIENISEGSLLPTPFAPGVWVVHTQDGPLFSEGAADPGLGLEALAEDGNPAGLAEVLAGQSGLLTPFAPGVWAVHTEADVLFTAGQADRGLGLAALAEDGNPATLAEALATLVGASGLFNTPVDASEPGPLLPGNAYEFTFEAAPGDKLSFATMFVQSNDLFYAPDGAGIDLFNAAGVPVTGDVTDQVLLWDAGSEVNEVPGFGSNQAPRQAGPDTGPDENGVVQVVADEFSYPDTTGTIRVVISAE